MISQKTVFILGAGASKPFGLPTGQELLDIISESLIYKPFTIYDHEIPSNIYIQNQKVIKDDNKSNNPFFQLLINLGYSRKEIEKFSQDLKQSQLNSIDSFLEYRTEYIEIGKYCIAYNLLKRESEKFLFSNSDWYKYLWTRLSTNFEDISKNTISFITFNYDRSLEFYFTKSMSALFDKSDEECLLKLSEIPIIHLHGQLGYLPFDSNENKIKYGEEIESVDQLKMAAKSIKIVHESIHEDPQFTQAKKLINEAEKICILGFGFNHKNVERLQLSNISCPAYASMFGYTSHELYYIINKIGSINKNNVIQGDCLNLLRNKFPFT